MNKLYILAMIAVVPFIVCFPNGDSNSDKDYDMGSDADSDTDSDSEGITCTMDPDMDCNMIDPFWIYREQRKFAVSLLNAARKVAPEDNHFLSAHSTFHALLLAYFGTEGEATESLGRALHLGWAYDKSGVIAAYEEMKMLRKDWRTFERSIEFNTVEKIYVTKAAELNENITDLLGDSIEKVDFTQSEELRAVINAFVEEVTKGHIKELLTPGTIMPSTNLVSLNAAFFKGLWKTQFDKAQTAPKPFNSAAPSNVEMMHVQGQFRYGVNQKLNAAYLDMPYEGENDEISMQVFLPLENTPTAVDDLLDKLTVEDIHEVMGQHVLLDDSTEEDDVLIWERPTQLVDVEFPKISMDVTYKSLTNVLEKMGVKKLFGSEAVMSGLSNSSHLYFDDIVHRAKIEIDEEGSTAAAATVSVTRGMNPAPSVEPVKFHCNHPFVFMINDAASDNILFAGIYRGPSK